MPSQEKKSHLSDWRQNGYCPQFGKRTKNGITSYRSYVEDLGADAPENPHKHIVGGLILTDTDFIKRAVSLFQG